MAVTAVNLIHTESARVPGQRTGTKVHRVQVNVPGTDDCETARTASFGGITVPDLSDAWSSTDSAMVCVSVEPRQETEAGLTFLVTSKYSTLGLPPITSENPLDEPPDISWDVVESVQAIDRAYNTNGALVVPVVNSAGVPFDPPIEGEIYDAMVTVVRNEQNFDPSNILDFTNTVNQSSFTVDGETIAAGQARVARILLTHEFRNNVNYDRVTYQIVFRTDGWTRYRLDDSRVYKFPVPSPAGGILGTVLLVATDENGYPMNEPILLDGDGLPINGTGVLDPNQEAVYLPFNVYKRTNFATLNLP